MVERRGCDLAVAAQVGLRLCPGVPSASTTALVKAAIAPGTTGSRDCAP